MNDVLTNVADRQEDSHWQTCFPHNTTYHATRRSASFHSVR